MHDSCAPTSNAVKQGDNWLAAEIPRIMASSAYRNGGAIFVTWDEGRLSLSCLSNNCPFGMIVISTLGKGGGYANSIAYTHSSTLRTMQEIFGVTPLLRGAATATDLRDLFRTFP